VYCICGYRGCSNGALRAEGVVLVDGVKGGRIRSFRKLLPKAGAKGVSGVLGVDMYRPLHFGHRVKSSDGEVDGGRAPFVFPARRGWYR